MGLIHPPPPVIGICGLLLAAGQAEKPILDALAGAFGDLAERWGPAPFTHTEYYHRQSGPDLRRLFVAFDRPIDPGGLAEMKVRGNDLEAVWAAARPSGAPPRPVNIDPGYVALPRVVLASTKEAGHRIYIGQGIWAEITLLYRHGRWNPLPWTFPDFRPPEYHPFFTAVRERLRRLRRGADEPGGAPPAPARPSKG